MDIQEIVKEAQRELPPIHPTFISGVVNYLTDVLGIMAAADIVGENPINAVPSKHVPLVSALCALNEVKVIDLEALLCDRWRHDTTPEQLQTAVKLALKYVKSFTPFRPQRTEP